MVPDPVPGGHDLRDPGRVRLRPPSGEEERRGDVLVGERPEDPGQSRAPAPASNVNATTVRVVGRTVTSWPRNAAGTMPFSPGGEGGPVLGGRRVVVGAAPDVSVVVSVVVPAVGGAGATPVTGPGSTGVGPPQPITAASAATSTTHLAVFARCTLTSRSRSPSRAPKETAGCATPQPADPAETARRSGRSRHRVHHRLGDRGSPPGRQAAASGASQACTSHAAAPSACFTASTTPSTWSPSSALNTALTPIVGVDVRARAPNINICRLRVRRSAARRGRRVGRRDGGGHRGPR